MTLPDALTAQVEAWIADDPDPRDRAELQTLLDNNETAELADRFRGPLEFGTAGLRGVVAAGEHRMNRAVVRRTTAGLASYLRSRKLESVVIGRDARHRSDMFAADVAAVSAGAGLRALLLPDPLPTPVLAFAVRHLGVDAGVMVTASHNPPADNGYKVYLGDGAQIIPPADRDIAAAIAAVASVAALPLGDDVTRLGDEVVTAYVEAAAALVPASAEPRLDVVVTPLHGVGRDTLLRALDRSGFATPYVVPEQSDPDPDFPTLPFPNPEEPGALDLAIAAAKSRDADLVLANDPDADRMDAAIPDATAPSGWRTLRGDELGVLLGDDLLRRGSGAQRLVAASIVSSSMLARIATAHGAQFRATLTGFKWIARAADSVSNSEFVFGYEEALGFCVGQLVRDKDGITAALALLRLAEELSAAGTTLQDRLDELDRTYGVHHTEQLSIRVDTVDALARITAPLDALRAAPPTTLGGLVVTEVLDLRESPTGLPATDGIVLRCGDQTRVIVRPSGTEPKLKAYLQAVVPVTGELATARDTARALAAEQRRDLSERLAL